MGMARRNRVVAFAGIQQQGIDTATPLGEAMMQMSGIFAQFERTMIVERTKAGMERARAKGKPCPSMRA